MPTPLDLFKLMNTHPPRRLFHHIHFPHNLPSAYGENERIGFIHRTATNLVQKAIYGAKWQNFAAGVGTGATYVTLHALHWHPHWLTVVE